MVQVFLTVEQAKRLHDSIDAAKGYAKRVYQYEGAPMCVIAHLAIREGVPAEDMRLWDHLEFNRVYSIHSMALASYPGALLDVLQRIWDQSMSYFTEDEETAKKLMHARVDERIVQ